PLTAPRLRRGLAPLAAADRSRLRRELAPARSRLRRELAPARSRLRRELAPLGALAAARSFSLVESPDLPLPSRHFVRRRSALARKPGDRRRRCCVFCPNCGTQNSETASTCTKCGFNLKGAAAPKFKGTMLMNQ